MKTIFCLFIFFILAHNQLFAQSTVEYDPYNMPKELTDSERLIMDQIGLNFTPTPPPSGTIRNISEFERNEAVLIRYTPQQSGSLAWPLDLIASLSEQVKVVTIVATRNIQSEAYSRFLQAGVNMDNVEFLRASTNSVWTRDYGPFYIADENHQVSVVDFKYNRPRPLDDAIPTQLASKFDMPVYGMNIVHTGGNYMTDGHGISASTDLVYEENNFNESVVLQNMTNFLNIETYHVTIDPQDTYLKHIDTWSKFLDVDKILIARVPPGNPQYQEHEQVVAYFENQLSAWGTPYQIFRVDTPNGQPYTNSLIVNERVYVPLMNSTWDSAAIDAYEEALPGYEILGFTGNPGFNWQSTDALHCRVKEIPDRGMLHLSHTPYTGTYDYVSEKEFEIDIIPYSGEPVVADSLFLIYRFDEAPYDTLSLTQVDEHTFSASMPVLPDGGTVSYYFYAADESGRKEHFPLIGKAGARSFEINATTVSAPQETPMSFTLTQNYPNPFNPSTVIGYMIEEPGDVQLSVYNMLGQNVQSLVDAYQTPGEYSVTFNAEGLSSGIYIYRIAFNGDDSGLATQTKRMVLIR